ncbi:MAG: PaaX family transcriptional regulator C-terminal domain-containing protein [Pseudomonadota bacterium]|nr:PaaX family transcriptional regulator C-terminal domain-containing protein [Pseudomonadota bacterium]
MTASPEIDRLLALGPLKVWSVVVTIMGDLCRDPEDRIEGPLLTRLVEGMGINNQALRVALHRLKRDGWIEAERDGRVSTYALTPEGRARTEAVRPVIYAATPPAATTVSLVLPAPDMATQEFVDALPDDTVFPGSRSALTTGTLDASLTEALVTPLDPAALPDWVAGVAISPAALAEYDALAEALATLPTSPDDLTQCTILRLIAFHHWRRLRLRHGALPDLILGPDWPGARARAAITAHLTTHPRPTLDALRAAAANTAS